MTPIIVLGIIIVILYFIMRPEEEEQEQKVNQKNLSHFKFPSEIETIFSVVEAYLETYKNTLNLYPLLVNPYAFMLAVRMCEQGRPGLEFGVMAAKDTDLKTQAEWTMATLIKDTKRWHTDKLANGKKKSDYPSFIFYFGDKWSPVGAGNDPTNLNQHWLLNFQKFYKLFLP